LKPAAFVHHRPRSIVEVTQLLADLADQNVRILAGGQSLVPMMAFRLARPDHLVDINTVSDFQMLTVGQSELRIGALVRHTDLEKVAGAGATGKLLAQVLPSIAHFPIRTRGTFCGSVAHADPASEWCLVAVALGARMVLTSTEGAREVKASGFFEGAMATVARPSEVLSEVRLPLLPVGTRIGFQEFSRRRGDFALSMALTMFRIESGLIQEPCIAIGGAEDRPRRFTAAEATLAGRAPSADLFDAASQMVAQDLQPMEAQGTTAAYRRDLTRALTLRALEEAAK
jgi:carbon-monoxide dehydrogenase medium subunit